MLAEALTASTSQDSDLPLAIQGLTTRNWEASLRALLPPETLKTLGEKALRSLFDYLNGKTDNAQVSLAPLKASLTSDSGVQAVFLLLSTQPDCMLAQVAQMTLAIFERSVIQFCNPPSEIHSLITPAIELQLRITAAALPDQVTLAKQEYSSTKNDPREQLRIVRLLMRLSPLIPLTFLFSLTILAVRSFVNWLDWWGIPLFITGTLATLLGLTGAPIVGLILQQILVDNMPTYLPIILLDYGIELAAAMVNQLLKPMLWEGLLLTMIGIIMIAVSVPLKRKKALLALSS
jgi:hypothetical protein